MIEINWNKIETKYKFAAIDYDGEVYVYEYKPRPMMASCCWIAKGDCLTVEEVDYCKKWKDSLQERPME